MGLKVKTKMAINPEIIPELESESYAEIADLKDWPWESNILPDFETALGHLVLARVITAEQAYRQMG